tara:strand:- start:1451 stop:1708 length:258 start_codon:yes stop_codon:yes gene_type:complete
MAKSKPRNYDREYKKFHKSIKAKKKRALLNGLKDCPPGQDNSHVGGKIKCKKGSSNRAENSDPKTAGGRYPGRSKDKSTWGKTPK